jgi:hypothetical protein
MGTYGSGRRTFRGYSANQDCSVGYWSDHDAEARAFRERQKQARKTLAGFQPVFQKIYDRFADGAHPWRRHVAQLDRDRTREHQDDYKVRFVLPPFKDRGTEGRIALHLYLKRDLAPAERELALAGFLLSQAVHWRELFALEPVADRFEDILLGWGWMETCLAFPRAFQKALADEDALRRDPTPHAALLRSAVDGTAIPDEVVATLEPGLLLRFSSDRQWPQILARARGAMVDPQHRDWWKPVLG